MEHKLLQELRCLLRRKPSSAAPPSAVDEFHLRLQEIFGEIITRYPGYAVGQKLELEMWNTLYKNQIDALQHALGRRSTGPPGTNVQGQPRSSMELKLRFVLLLDRASGVYLTLVQRLLHSLPGLSWPKWILSTTTSLAAPAGLFSYGQLGRTCGRFDLDLATFSALHRISATVYSNSRWLERRTELDSATTSNPAPRILSRGDRLPAVQSHPQQGTTDAVEESPPSSSVDGFPLNQPSRPSEDTQPVEMDSPLSTIDHSIAVNYLVQHCLVHLGDIARYRQQLNVAAGYYIWGWIVHPDSGHPFNQLAILESSKGAKKRSDTLFYYYVRAIACEYPFPAASTNLTSMLRGALSCSNHTKPSESLDDNSTSVVQWKKDPRQLLFYFYAALQLCSDASRLVALANEFSNAINCSYQDNWTASDSQSLMRLVTLHVYLLMEHSMDSKSTAKSEVGRTLLLHCTVRLCDWIARQYLAHNQETKQYHGSIRHSLLASLSLLFLWLRQQACTHPVSLDAAFRTYAPPLSEEFTSFLNDLLPLGPPNESDIHSSPGSVDELDNELDWKRLIRLSEISLLQGFKPLQIPTQQRLCEMESQAPLFPFNMNWSHAPNSVKPLQTDADQPDDDLLHYFRLTSSQQIIHERIKFILKSARIVAREYPALLGWIDGDSGPPNSSFLNGRFRAIARTPPLLAELIIPSPISHQPSSENIPLDENNLAIRHRTEAPSSTENQPLFNHHTVPLQAEIQPKENAINTSDQCVPTEQSLPVQSSADAASDASSEPTAHVGQIAGERNLHSVTPRPPNELLEWSTTPANSVEQISSRTADAARSSSTTAASGSASGGLIVNAELAKFIQEQASQVAARQQRAELSSLSPNVNGDHPDAANRAPSTTSDGSSIHRTSKANQARLCLSAAFRRDLPPRFARRLQAELLEREAQEQRLGTNVESSDKLNSLTSSIAMLNLDQPAPLARKESEAPFELNSLLSTTGDPVGSDEMIPPPAVNPIEAGIFSSGSFQPAHVLHPRQLTTSSTPFLTPIQNASLDVNPRSYVAPPLPMYPTPPMPLPFSRAHMIPDFQTPPPTAPPAPSMFGSQIPPRSSLYDWHPPNRVFDAVTAAPVSFALPYTSTVIPAQPVHSTISNPLLPISEHLPPLDVDNFGEGVGFPGQYRLRSLGQSAEYNSAAVNTDAASFVQQSLLMDNSATSTKGFVYPTEGLLNSNVLHPAAVVTSTEQEQCLNFPPVP
ncbi:protein SMG7 [Clonorchis sinensis]|uniref:Protein SMG7 n=1 Tax=Clonorchis sinensis TaxID=79923 RepID=G7Y4H5_CLOSI|nr:protein SMG7 [Clonorchis sinensis]